MPKVKPRVNAGSVPEAIPQAAVQIHVAASASASASSSPSVAGEREDEEGVRVDFSQQDAGEAIRNEPSPSSARGEGEQPASFPAAAAAAAAAGEEQEGVGLAAGGRAEGESVESARRRYDGRDRWLIPLHSHPLIQCFDRYGDRGFQCDICKQNGVNCSFSCEECDFDVHVICFDAQNGYERYIIDPKSNLTVLEQMDAARQRAQEKKQQHAEGNYHGPAAPQPSVAVAASVSSPPPVAPSRIDPNYDEEGVELVAIPAIDPAYPSQVPLFMRPQHLGGNAPRNAAAEPAQNNRSPNVVPNENNNEGGGNRQDDADSHEKYPSWCKLSSDQLYMVQVFIGILVAIIWVIEAANMGTYAAQNGQAQIMKNCEGDLAYTCRPDECKVNCDDTGLFCEHIFCWSLDYIAGSCSISTTASGARDTQTGLLDRSCNAEWYFNRTEPLGCVELCAGQKRFVRETAAAWLTWRACDVLLYFAPWQLYGFAVLYAPYLFMHDLFTIATIGTPLRNLYAVDITIWCLWGVWSFVCFMSTIFMLGRPNPWARSAYEFGRWGTKFIPICVAAWQLNVSETGFSGCIHNAYAKGWGELGLNMILAHVVAALNMLYGLIAICAASARRHDKENLDWRV